MKLSSTDILPLVSRCSKPSPLLVPRLLQLFEVLLALIALPSDIRLLSSVVVGDIDVEVVEADVLLLLVTSCG